MKKLTWDIDDAGLTSNGYTIIPSDVKGWFVYKGLDKLGKFPTMSQAQLFVEGECQLE